MARALRVIGRWLSPTTLVLAGLCFLLPFATVACDTPGGFGRAAPGGSTVYSGVTLMTGGAPEVTPPEKELPRASARGDRIGAQPLAVIVFLLIVAAVVGSIAIRPVGARRANVALAAAGALVMVVLNQAIVVGLLIDKVRGQLTQPLPAGKVVRDYVQTGPGFVLCAALLLFTVAPNLIGWLMSRQPLRNGGATSPQTHYLT